MNSQPQFSRTVFICNPRSGSLGSKRSILRLIDQIWSRNGRKYSIIVTTRAGEGEHLAREEVSRGAELVVAVGGDGTLNEVVRGVLGTAACVGLLPAGSGNGFARHFGLPLNLTKACQGLMHPQLIRCDVGVADERIFIVTFGCGIDASISDRYQHSTMRGMLSYFYHGARAFKEYREIETRVLSGGREVYSGRPMLLTFANVRGYGGGTIIAPQARTDDGLLDVVAIDPLSLKNSLLNLRELFSGSIYKIPGYHHTQIQEAVVERAARGAIHLDGDPYMGEREMHVRIMPQALPFALPETVGI